MKLSKYFLCAALCVLCAAQLAAQEELSRSFRNVSLGLSLDALKQALNDDSSFRFRGDRDISFLSNKAESLVETSGTGFIKRAFFQLRDGTVYIMAFSLDTVQIDHYSVFNGLVKKYGPPQFLDPQQAVWEAGTTRIALERPLTVKYIDTAVFGAGIQQSRARPSDHVRLREDFINEF
ncbi:hypothetical protein ACYULU_04795 [Breznakiellaceae bacterium SP9]